MIYIIGLGNPGAQYQKTRHNAGALVLEHIRERFNFPEFQIKKTAQAFVSEGSIVGHEALLVFPQTFMNLSGVSVAKICKYMKPDDMLVVIYDDLDVPVGKLKLSYEKSAGGHNGVASIIEHLGSKAFIRIRIGISPVGEDGKVIRPVPNDTQHDFVLTSFRPEEKDAIMSLVPKVQEILISLIQKGREKTMSLLGAK
jgi:PTH1 family peptidyl-tRNA hydrolase